MRRHVVALLAVVAAVAPVTAARAAAPRPTVVVAVADTGVNPYHEVFRRPKKTRHPCTYVAGFSCAIPALRLSIGKYQDYRRAVVEDREVWASVRPHQWYWIPGTNIVGAVCDHEYTSLTKPTPPPDPDVPGSSTCILDNDGHGTATASAVLSEAPDALLLVHEGDAAGRDLATAPVRPDVQSHSWAPPAPVPFQAGDALVESDELCPDAWRRPETLYFLAAGNEAPFPALADCARSTADVHVVGGTFPGYWDTDSWSMYDFASWYCRPTAVSGATKGSQEGCGTSVAAPTAAGTAAAALLRIRTRDHYTGRGTRTHVSRTVTRERFERALRDGASYDPKPKFPNGPCTKLDPCLVHGFETRWVPLPAAQARFLFWGYGWLDSTVTDAVVACAVAACPGKAAHEVAVNDARQQARAAQEVENGPLVAQHDAGSNRDAGPSLDTAVPVVAGRDYDARVEPHAWSGDVDDWFTIRLRRGQRLTLTSVASLHGAVPADATPYAGCWRLLAADGSQVGGRVAQLSMRYAGCGSTEPNPLPSDVRVPATGTYVLAYTAQNGLPPHDYRFRVSVAG